MNKPKYIFVTGGVTSSLGKGIISASLARLLQAQGLNVGIQKLDPYINVDPGTKIYFGLFIRIEYYFRTQIYKILKYNLIY